MEHHPTPTRITAAIAILLLITACKKEVTTLPDTVAPPVNTKATLIVDHHIDGQGMVLNSQEYTNAAGNVYTITRLEYYLSDITFHGTNGTPDLIIPGPFLINGNAPNSFDLGTLSAGEYAGASGFLGLTPAMNVTGALPNTTENINMAWPVPMGGGYHFMKFEGHFLNNGISTGYAMHLGRNENLPALAMLQAFSLDGTGDEIELLFNLNQVFREPHTYDLSTSNYSMGSMELMGQLRDNCVNAFTIATRP